MRNVCKKFKTLGSAPAAGSGLRQPVLHAHESTKQMYEAAAKNRIPDSIAGRQHHTDSDGKQVTRAG